MVTTIYSWMNRELCKSGEFHVFYNVEGPNSSQTPSHTFIVHREQLFSVGILFLSVPIYYIIYIFIDWLSFKTFWTTLHSDFVSTSHAQMTKKLDKKIFTIHYITYDFLIQYYILVVVWQFIFIYFFYLYTLYIYRSHGR